MSHVKYRAASTSWNSCKAYIESNLTSNIHSLQDFFQDVANKGVLNLPIAGKDEEPTDQERETQGHPLGSCFTPCLQQEFSFDHADIHQVILYQVVFSWIRSTSIISIHIIVNAIFLYICYDHFHDHSLIIYHILCILTIVFGNCYYCCHQSLILLCIIIATC